MRKSTKKNRGFTLIEVLVSLLVFMVAMVGLVAMQRASISGASLGREQTGAINVARYVLTWLENDAAAWPVSDTTTPSSLQLLGSALSDTDSSTWHTISDDTTMRFDQYLETSSSAVASYGAGSSDTAPYCVGFRVKPLSSDQTQVMYQVWVRVVWPRWGQYSGWQTCDAARLSSVESSTLQVVELTGVVTREFTSRWSQDS
jgi:prepilin-type N-terminal cleavage/methylation domain-containing protein